eukprot:gene27391-36160_t
MIASSSSDEDKKQKQRDATKKRVDENRDSASNELKIWYYRLEDCDYDLKLAKDNFQKDREELSVVAALIMTIGFAGLVLTPSYFESSGWSGALQFIIPFLWAFSSFMSTLCVWSSSFESITILHVKDGDYLDYLEEVVSICVSPFSYMKWSLFTLLLAAAFQVISMDDMLYPGYMVLAMAVVTAIIGQRHEYKVNKFMCSKHNIKTTVDTWWHFLIPCKWPDIIYRGICGGMDRTRTCCSTTKTPVEANIGDDHHKILIENAINSID